jgi:hypothetical protein
MRIKHNDLTHWFIRDHDQLPRAYLRKCEKFFQSIQDRLITKKDAAFLFKHQAMKEKQQASSVKHQARQTGQLFKPGLRVKNRFNRKV